VSVLLPVLAALGCSDGIENPVGTAEPFRMHSAQFFAGALPGYQTGSNPYDPAGPPRVNDMMMNGRYFVAGTSGKKLPGHVSLNSYSVGFQLAGAGTGWWMIPADEADPLANPPGLNFTGIADFSPDLAPGRHVMHVVALGHSGEAGAQFNEPLCVASTGPSFNSECGGDPIPAAAITLTWDTNVDLDLRVVAPDGRIVSSKHPQLHDPGKGEADLNLPHIDRDSNAGCVLDGFRSESLIWPTVPAGEGDTELPAGLYQVYVNLFDACGQQAVRFHVTITEAAPPDDGGSGDEGSAGASGSGDETPTLVERTLLDQAGELIAVQVSPADDKGLFVTQYTF
jgi:hypothetical protein